MDTFSDGSPHPPRVELANRNYSEFLSKLITKKQYKKDIYCEDLIERAFSLSGIRYTQGEIEYTNFNDKENYQNKKNNYDSHFRADFFHIDDELYILLNQNSSKIALQKRTSRKQNLLWHEIPDNGSRKPTSFIKDKEIYVESNSSFYKFVDNNSTFLEDQKNLIAIPLLLAGCSLIFR